MLKTKLEDCVNLHSYTEWNILVQHYRTWKMNKWQFITYRSFNMRIPQYYGFYTSNWSEGVDFFKLDFNI